jgi:polygalacturonase
VTSKCPVANEAGRTINTDELSWWDLAPCAAANSLEQNTPPLIKAFGASHVLFHDIHLLNSPHQHLIVKNTSDAMIWGIHIHVDSPSSAKNADGIDLSGVTNATVANSYIESGDDHIAIDAVSHAATAITIFGNHLYAGHGMSIGSEVLAGVSNVLVKNLTIDGGSIPVLKDQLILRAPGAITGLHIKSDDVNGGLVEKVVYENVCIRNTSYPIELQTNYSANLKVGDTSGSHYPSYRNIVMQNIYAFNDEFAAGPLVFNGYENASADVTNVTAVYLSNVLTDSSGVQSSLLPAYMKGSQSTTFRSRALTSSYSLLKLYGEVNFTPDDPSNTVANGHSGYINLNALPTQTQSSCLGTVGDLQFEPYR